jgi:cell wall assembly regulator SMI1
MDSWKRIERWLQTNAPDLRAKLRDGAEAAHFDEVGRIFGAQLSASTRALHAAHDGLDVDRGLGSLFFGFDFLSLRRALDRRELVPRPTWLAFAHDGSRSYLFVELGESPQPVRLWDGDLELVHDIAPDAETFLATFAADLEAGGYSLDPDAKADGVDFLQASAEVQAQIGTGVPLPYGGPEPAELHRMIDQLWHTRRLPSSLLPAASTKWPVDVWLPALRNANLNATRAALHMMEELHMTAEQTAPALRDAGYSAQDIHEALRANGVHADTVEQILSRI